MTAVSAGAHTSRLDELLRFQEKLNFCFQDITLLDRALTHRSCSNEGSGPPVHNETLEFLGDAVLALVVANALFRRLEQRPEGELARIKSWVVSEASLAPLGIGLGIPSVLLLGRGEEMSGGRQKKAIIADALEAVFGAMMVDSGYKKASACIDALMEDRIQEAISGDMRDCKTSLQEYAQKNLQSLPVYHLEKTEGPEHDRLFYVSCAIEGRPAASGRGKTKKDAEQAAASALLRTLGIGHCL